MRPSPLMKRFSKGPMDSGWGELPACAVVRITAASGLADKDVNHMVFLCHHWANVLLEELTMASGESPSFPPSESSTAATGWRGGMHSAAMSSSRWSTILYDLLFAIALRLKDLAVPRLVCKPWWDAFPGPPFLVCSTHLLEEPLVGESQVLGHFLPCKLQKIFPQIQSVGVDLLMYLG
ncbi:hypothetical protein EE612_052314 [Oryza sativa]|nr:hypothetical protein EE612_052314 [Oryza sativa]KAB8113341.1 hypothetical protein EE612_052314 [Oryza sativa]